MTKRLAKQEANYCYFQSSPVHTWRFQTENGQHDIVNSSKDVVFRQGGLKFTLKFITFSLTLKPCSRATNW